MKRGEHMKAAKEIGLLKQGFALNPFYEKLGTLRATNPQAFASLSPASKLVLYEYEKQKREHERLQAIRPEQRCAARRRAPLLRHS